MIEVELRGLLNEQKYRALIKFLQRASSRYEADDKTATFFKYPAGILKTVEETSKQRYKLSLKIGNEFNGKGMKEMEVYMTSPDAITTTNLILQNLGYSIDSVVEQTRQNYNYNGAEISLKYTQSWGYHFEIEKLVNDETQIASARRALLHLCTELDIKPLSEEELKRFIYSLRK